MTRAEALAALKPMVDRGAFDSRRPLDEHDFLNAIEALGVLKFDAPFVPYQPGATLHLALAQPPDPGNTAAVHEVDAVRVLRNVGYVVARPRGPAETDELLRVIAAVNTSTGAFSLLAAIQGAGFTIVKTP